MSSNPADPKGRIVAGRPSAGTAKVPDALRIAISGKSGCGNSTVSRIVAERLGLRVINYTFKDLSRDRGMSFEEVCLRAEQDPQYDLTIDKMQIELASEGPCVLGSRLAIWLLHDIAFTVYLYAPVEVRAARIARREEKDVALALKETTLRDQRDHDRYSRLYGYDVDRYTFAALVIDTGPIGIEEVVEEIVRSATR
jgi:CMP/dCMP kinase